MRFKKYTSSLLRREQLKILLEERGNSTLWCPRYSKKRFEAIDKVKKWTFVHFCPKVELPSFSKVSNYTINTIGFLWHWMIYKCHDPINQNSKKVLCGSVFYFLFAITFVFLVQSNVNIGSRHVLYKNILNHDILQINLGEFINKNIYYYRNLQIS